MKTDVRFLSLLTQFFLEWEMFQTKVVEKISVQYFFPPEIVAFII